MKIFDFLDNEYTGANIDLQNGFDASLKAKTEAVAVLVKWHRAVLKTRWVVKLVVAYILCSITGTWPDKANLEDFMKQKQAELAEKKAATKPEPPKLEVVPCPENNAN